jgi:putative addiction module component (TIGR02574 family)
MQFMTTKDTIIDTAMKLPAEERLEVAEKLFESVEGEAGAEEAWAEEIARRVAAIDSGEAKLISWDEARKQIPE